MNVTSKRWDVSRARSLISRSTEHRFVVGGYAAARQVASRAPREPSRRKLLVRTAASVSTPRKGSGDTQQDVDAENVQLPSNNPKTLADSGPDGENIVASETGDRHEVTSVAENPPLDAVVTREIVPTVSVSNSPIPVSKGLNASFSAVVVGVAAVTAAVFGAFAVGRSLARRTAGGNENAIVRGLGIVDTIQARMLRRRQQREAIIRLNEFMGLIQTQTKVDLSAKNLGEKGGAYVLDSLAFNTVCQSLDLSNNGLGLVAVTQLCEVLKANDTLKSLSLSTNSAGDEGAVLIAQYMAGDASVASLKLNSNNINNEGAIALAEMLKTNTTLTSLELNNNGIEYDGAVALAEALAENNSIKVLGLSGNYLGPMGVSVLAQALKVNTSVEEIYIQGNDGGDVGVKSLCDALFERPGPIKTLDIGNNTMTEEGAQSLAKLLKAKQLVELDVYNNDFGDAGMYEIAGSLKDNKSLTSLDLGGNNVGADGIKALASAIKNCNTLRVLELSYNPMGPEGAKAIAEVSKYDLQLETLKVGWCKIGSGDGAKAIGDLIMFNTTISSLDLRGNNLGDEGAISIARSMKEHDNQHFAELDMGYNEIKDAGACALAQSLKANVEGAVKELKLNQNYITRFGQVALTEALDLVYELGGGKETTIVF